MKLPPSSRGLILPLQECTSHTFKFICPLFPFRAFVLPLQELNGVNYKCNFPFPHVFSLSPFPSACLEGTHGDRVAGDNTQHSHRLLSSSFYVTRSRTKRIQTRPLTCTTHQARRSLGSPPLRLVFRLRMSKFRV